jgi:signal transduction histidine kinase
MSVESKVGQGTTFRLRLPTAEGAPQPRPAPTLEQAR